MNENVRKDVEETDYDRKYKYMRPLARASFNAIMNEANHHNGIKKREYHLDRGEIEWETAYYSGNGIDIVEEVADLFIWESVHDFEEETICDVIEFRYEAQPIFVKIEVTPESIIVTRSNDDRSFEWLKTFWDLRRSLDELAKLID